MSARLTRVRSLSAYATNLHVSLVPAEVSALDAKAPRAGRTLEWLQIPTQGNLSQPPRAVEKCWPLATCCPLGFADAIVPAAYRLRL